MKFRSAHVSARSLFASPLGTGRRAPRASGEGTRAFSSMLVSPGFTLLELAIVIFIMGLMLTLTMPYLGGFRRAQLRSQARRLAGRATYMFDQAAGHKLVLRLIFDIDINGYAVARLDPYSIKPVFAPDHTPSSRPVQMPSAIRIRDVTVEGIGTVNRGAVTCHFYPHRYVDDTVVHLEDASGDVMPLQFPPLPPPVPSIDGAVFPP